jgi:hypothetical protein
MSWHSYFSGIDDGQGKHGHISASFDGNLNMKGHPFPLAILDE